jgi:hypothetical protein
MRARDSSDLPITNADAEAASRYDGYVREFLAYGSQLRQLFDLADLYPGSALINAHAAALHLAFEAASGFELADPYLARANAAATDATPRERQFFAAVEAWRGRDFHSALAHLDELTVVWPADLCAIKWAQYHAFNLGDQAGLLRFAERARVVHEGQKYAHGMIAFALEQNHRLAEAEAEGLCAVEISIDDAWAHHALAHVYETTGRPREGARWLDRCAHLWDAKGVFIRDHNWWHAALFRLALGRHDEALAIFDRRLWGEWPEFPQEQIGAVSMLWRLELRGADVGGRWKPVADEARRRAGDRLLPFHDLHYLFALARGGLPGEADRMLADIEAFAATRHGPDQRAWARACAPAARAVLAFARGDWAAAAAGLETALPHLSAVGGSHAQRHLFVELLEAARNGGARAAAPWGRAMGQSPARVPRGR